ncbi:hypothetical protein Patl1_20443 [Pistacia atlantica]|uniref:Uncharacterized protein n=1 Tax=Pistacia atlantica TaxID=434234 RepID=A0ACC1BIM8_9ROSI|nr:hypothetical protein Patl1_20443 [Pistacia atlantica]
MPLGFGVLPFCFSVIFLFCLLTREPCGTCGFVDECSGIMFFLLVVSCGGVVLFKEEGGKAWRLLDFLFLECLQQMGAWQVAGVRGLVCDFSVGWSADDSSNSNDPFQEQHNEQVRKLRILLQQNRTRTAENLLKSLLISKDSRVSFPHELFSLFSISLPSLKPIFSSMLFALLECLVNCNQFDKTLELFEEIVGSGFRLDRFTYGKAVQAAVKLDDLDRSFEIESTKRR